MIERWVHEGDLTPCWGTPVENLPSASGPGIERDGELCLRNHIRRPYPKQDRMVEWLADKPIPPGFEAIIDAEGHLSFLRVAPVAESSES